MKKPTFKAAESLKEFDRRFFDRGIGILCGVDEAGRGPLAGPVVASAVVVRDFDFSNKIDDSKKLSALQRERAFEEILRKGTVSISAVGEGRIDEINIYQASVEAMSEALRGLPLRPELVLVDGPPQLATPYATENITGGDGLSFTIACASIVAKVVRDRIMSSFHDLYPGYGFDRHKGYGTRQHLLALHHQGPCPIHRKSFAPVRAESLS